MAIESICTGCGQKLSVADENAGKQARCPACGNIYTIPFPAATQADHPAVPITASANASQQAEADQFWMRTADGAEYGPVDRATLDRWFGEGRVGPGYMLRQSEHGNWQSAEVFRPRSPHATSNRNPFADNPSQAPAASAGMYRYPKPDQGGLILAFGIIGFFVCPLVAIAAWIMGHTALKDIAAGQADPQGKTMVQVGYYLGIASVAINILCFFGYFVIVAIAIVGGAR